MTTSRTLGCIALLALAVPTAIPQIASARDGSFQATLKHGVVTVAQGDLLEFTDDGIYTYCDVPYATAARLKSHQTPECWEGIRVAMSYGEICPYPPKISVANDEQFNSHRYLPTSETCQFLSIWTPGINDHAKRPVLILLHDGGFSNGFSIEGTSYDGRNLAELDGIVVVSFNHRLNVLGARPFGIRP